ncbi:glycoside hydrolase family 27 protein [Planctomonas sp. JC2975]|uniref:glycoside hydrolase family 27 protein n=1 Tax=Planctomonas sp. JC2975 TaxID=2729626 RepID=UPI001473AEB7|nr:glycoside hydrolase family 27 protein [Planctomonas sp. JC2975]NNC11156.1 glycoside hydrolase family 27 protein [Planctomonas sp. JC2975]
MNGRRASVLLASLATTVCLLLAGCTAVPSVAGRAEVGAEVTTPPMGWNSWNHFGCSVTEADVRAAADAIAADGLRAAGYTFVNVDDCWQDPTRDSSGRLRANRERFPHGIAALAAYVHSKGLHFGLYAAPGRQTCAERYQGYPGSVGSFGHVEQDARIFAAWGVDYLKYDWCAADRDGVGHEQAFAQMRAALDATGRRIVFSIHDKPEQPAPAWRHWVADLSRTTPDIQDSWSSVVSIVRSTLASGTTHVSGYWNDPDMLEVGNSGMSDTEQRSHFALWAELSAPLLMGNDLSKASRATRDILGNTRIIAVDQDVLGAHPVTVAASSDHALVLAKPLADGGIAVTITALDATTSSISVSSRALGLGGASSGDDLETGERVTFGSTITVNLDGHATAMYTLLPHTSVPSS